MKNLSKILLIFLLTSFFWSYGQNIGNEWINHSQKYLRFPVTSTDMYKIPYETLEVGFSQMGLSLQDLDPRGLKIFGRGEELAIFVKGEEKGFLASGDYIEVFCKRNDGWFDTQLYKQPWHQANPYYSLFNDTASYYITWSSALDGKRFSHENNTNFSSFTAIPYFLFTSVQHYSSNYYLGYVSGQGISRIEYDEGEGWMDGAYSTGQSRTKNIPSANVFASGPPASVEMGVASASNPAHHMRIQFAGNVIDTIFFGYKYFRFNRNVSPQNLGATTTPFVFSSINDVNSASDRQTIAFVKVEYPHTTTLQNTNTYTLKVPNFGTLPKSVLRVTSNSIATAAGDSVRIFDLSNNIRIKAIKTGTQIEALLQNYGHDKELFITSDARMLVVNSLEAVNGNGSFVDYSTLEYRNSDYLIITHSSLWNEAQQYAQYRRTQGYPQLFNPVVVNIDDLYEQFSYGIRKNPLAIRNFLKYAIANFNEVPKYLFIIGKSYRSAENSTSMPTYRKTTTWYRNTLVPTICVPPSDLIFSSGLIDPNTDHPAIPTGRLSAKNGDHVTLYLNKVREHEQAIRNPQPWMKNILHFAGSTGTHHLTLLNFLNQYRNTIQDTLFGGYVRTFRKTTTDPIQINQSDSLKNIINNGVTLMTFFGHASGIGFDISIDNPEEYSNYGKYPLIFGLSCFAGDLFTTGAGNDRGSSSEEFVLIQNKGTIAYLASVSSALDGNLHVYASQFYKNFGSLMYAKPLGNIIQQTIRNLEHLPNMKETYFDMTYHGDPAIVLNSFEKPDYVIKPENIRFSPNNITTERDSFSVIIAPKNIAKAINDSIIVKVSRTLPNNQTVDVFVRVKAPLHTDTIRLNFPVDRLNGIGNNTLRVSLDDFNEIDEIDENNNVTSVNFLITSSDIIPVYPYKYAVVPTSQISLKASTGSVFTTSGTYVFEVDTIDSFNSPFKKNQNFQSSGGILTWDLPFTLSDSTVYYWRVAKQGSSNWRESSFQYINGKSGWGQAHFHQFKENQYQFVSYNKPQRKFDFVQDIKSITAQTGYFGYGMPWTEIWFRVNSIVMGQWSCLSNTGNGMKIAVFDPISGELWRNPDDIGQIGQSICKTYTTYDADFFTSDANNRLNLQNYLDSIPNGHYVLALSHRNNYASSYSEALYQSFESNGSSQIRNLQWNNPYIIFGRKGASIGDPEVVETVAANETQIIHMNTQFSTNWSQGSITSEMVGPALQWGSLHWRFKSLENPSSDKVNLNVIGIDNFGNENIIIANLSSDSLDIYDLQNRISVQQYPYLKLQLLTKDTVYTTPSQLIRWHVVYDPAPETAIDPSVALMFHKETVEQGDSVKLRISTRNIGGVDMDSLLVTYRILKDNVPVKTFTKRLRNHPADDVLTDEISISTSNLMGINTLQVEFNPDNDQPEMYHFNNIAEFYFNVNPDRINPIMDVTFDGVHIMNGDIVSAKPQIQITLKDENPYLLLNSIQDTALFRVQLMAPGETEFKTIPFFDGTKMQMQFIPAGQNNKAFILFNAEFPVDGVYRMTVEGMDKSGNLSGNNKYSITFEVINKSTITDVMNWPNPFSTSTRFVFTLTGSELPTYFKIQIMTISGKLVREIDLSEIGPIHIGRNITQYAWDGRDQFGDRLANGVYLYRIVTNIRGEDIEKRASGASKYFTKDFGKMVIIR